MTSTLTRGVLKGYWQKCANIDKVAKEEHGVNCAPRQHEKYAPSLLPLLDDPELLLRKDRTAGKFSPSSASVKDF